MQPIDPPEPERRPDRGGVPAWNCSPDTEPASRDASDDARAGRSGPSSESPDWIELTRRLRRFGAALTGSADEAEDLCQQTLANLLSRRPDRVDHFGYARATLVRTWISQQRSLGRRIAHFARLAVAKTPWHVDAQPLENREQSERARAAIASLPPVQRSVLVLRLVEELDYAAIAETLGCSVQSARASLHLARERVRRNLGDSS